LSDPGVEDALYESPVLRRFVGIDLGRAPAPDETTILNFRHLLEEHELCGEMLDTVIGVDSKGRHRALGMHFICLGLGYPYAVRSAARQ
jgi:IS5 family transposase